MHPQLARNLAQGEFKPLLRGRTVARNRKSAFAPYTTSRNDRTLHRAGSSSVKPPVQGGSSPGRFEPRSAVRCFLNPWVDLANVSTDDAALSFKIDSVTRTFGVVAALMCSLSAAALAVTPSSEDDDEEEFRATSTENTERAKERETGIFEHIASSYERHVSGTSLLVSWGVPPRKLLDIYAGCCAASFYSSVCALGFSATVNAWLGATPPGRTSHFVRYHSLVICSIPGFLALSTGLAGVALFIGLDRSQGTPVSYIGLFGTAIGGVLIGTVTVRGMICTYRLLTPLVKKF